MKRLVHADGSTATFFNVAAWARDHGLAPTAVYGVLRGDRRSTGGWGLPGPGGGWGLLRDPHGVVHWVTPTLTAFCQKHGLQASNVCGLRTKKNKQHRGWSLAQ